MPRNVEIKARITSVGALRPIAAALADAGPTPIAQDDTFFACAAGRLKLRDFGDGRGELIFYRRDDAAGPKLSSYVRTPTGDPAGLREALALAHGVVGRVRKARTLFLAGRTRIHFDEVEGLGAFLELEVLLDDDEPVEQREVVADERLDDVLLVAHHRHAPEPHRGAPAAIGAGAAAGRRGRISTATAAAVMTPVMISAVRLAAKSNRPAGVTAACTTTIVAVTAPSSQA